MLWRLRKQVDIYAPEVAECEGYIYFLKNLAFLVSRSQMTAPSRHVPVFHYGIAGLAPVVFKPNDILH